MTNPEPLKGFFGNPASFSGAGLDAQYPLVVLGFNPVPFSGTGRFPLPAYKESSVLNITKNLF